MNLTCASDAWESALAAVFACKFARRFPRRYYTFRHFLLPDWREQVPPGYAMARVDQAFLARQDVVNLDKVRRQIGEWKDFARDGFGFCLVHGDTIVSQCLADCVSGSACEVGITTHRDYRRRGLGALTAAATVEYYLAHHLPTIGWHCLANNRGSQRVAEKVGFGLVGEYLHYSDGALAENADDLTQVEWQAHADFFERAFEALSQQSARMAWHAAQARALAGEPAQAMTLLRRLADSGTLPPGWDTWLREGWAFQSLQTDPGWSTLLARAQAARPAGGEA